MTKTAHELPASSSVGDNNKQGDAGAGFDDVPDEKEAEEEARWSTAQASNLMLNIHEPVKWNSHQNAS